MAKYSVKGMTRKMKSLTAADLYDMDKKELERFLNYQSKYVVNKIEKLIESGYADYSPLLQRRFSEDSRFLPKTIGLKEAKKMTIKELRDEITELSFLAKAKTLDVRGVKKYIKEFKETTGRDPSSLSSSDWEKIRKKIEEGVYSSSDIIASYSEQDENQSDEDYDDSWDDRIRMTEHERYLREQEKAERFKVK